MTYDEMDERLQDLKDYKRLPPPSSLASTTEHFKAFPHLVSVLGPEINRPHTSVGAVLFDGEAAQTSRSCKMETSHAAVDSNNNNNNKRNGQERGSVTDQKTE